MLAAQRMCASACTVQPLPGDHGKELQIQGTFDTQVRFPQKQNRISVHKSAGRGLSDEDFRH
jgi:hypothetical protein